jgi:colicin import membrane protein
MHAGTDRLEFAPPPQPGRMTALLLALIAHLLLMLALTWGIKWNRESENIAAEAELWASVPQQAAPKLVETPPPPPVPEKKAEPVPPPPTPEVNEAAIALEREKKKQELAQKKREELERQKKLEAKRKQEQLLAEKKAAEERKKKEDLAKAAKDKTKQVVDAKRAETRRRENLERMQALAGATGAPTATGTAIRSTGPSASYAAKINARIRPHIRHPQEVPGNPPVVIEVKTSPDGTIVGQRVVKSSGNPAWDESAIRAIIATGSLPRNEEGRVPTPMEITIRHRE